MLRDVKRMTSRRIPTGSDRYVASNKYTWARQVRSRSPLGSLRYGDYGLRTTAGRALSFVRSTGLSRANIER